MSVFRPVFEASLRALARATKYMKDRGYAAPILVGGGAVELYSGSTIATGDLDISTPWQTEFEQALTEQGFVRPTGPGQATRGWIHPDLGMGVEVVSSALLDGNADRERIKLIDFGSDGTISVISVEDMIADRLGQFASGTAPEMLEQAQKLLKLHGDADFDYMDRRIREETFGDYGIADLEAKSGEV